MNFKYVLIISMLLVSPALFANNLKANVTTTLANPTNELIVFKTPTCGCCKKWISHLEDENIVAHAKDYRDITDIKVKFKIRPNYRSCHTAISRNGFAFEGHVPAKFIKQFLKEEHSDAIGLSVPAMPIGSPGMEMADRFMPYRILILYPDGSSKVYAKINRYEEQF